MLLYYAVSALATIGDLFNTPRTCSLSVANLQGAKIHKRRLKIAIAILQWLIWKSVEPSVIVVDSVEKASARSALCRGLLAAGPSIRLPWLIDCVLPCHLGVIRHGNSLHRALGEEARGKEKTKNMVPGVHAYSGVED